MRLQYLGHSCFCIISDIGTTVVTDPYEGEKIGYCLPHLHTDFVTVSHYHFDHCCVEALGGNPSVIDCEIACAVDDVAVQSFRCFHDDAQGTKRGENLCFTFLTDGIKIAHMGDIGEQSEALAKSLAGTNVLLVPVGGKYTVDAVGAKWYVDRIKPQIVIPMHYQTEEGGVGVDGVQAFLDLFDNQQVATFNGDFLCFDDVPAGQTRVVVMKRFAD